MSRLILLIQNRQNSLHIKFTRPITAKACVFCALGTRFSELAQSAAKAPQERERQSVSGHRLTICGGLQNPLIAPDQIDLGATVF
jgi:hypothetical protein